MGKKEVHVVPRPEGGWAVKKSGAARASNVAETQREAIATGREIAKREGAELVVHGKDGQIREKDSHGRDPNPPKG